VTVETAGRPQPGAAPERYVPDSSRITTELNVRRRVGLELAIERTLAFHRAQPA
jgi:hypothetical protein